MIVCNALKVSFSARVLGFLQDPKLPPKNLFIALLAKFNGSIPSQLVFETTLT